MTQTLTTQTPPTIRWEILPENFVLPDDPVENILQPFLAAALTEALDLAGLIRPAMLVASNMGICTNVNGKTVVKAPDWFYVPRAIPPAEGAVRRSYPPHTEGDVPQIAMEFLSETDAGEYSIRPVFPYGKLWFYERILQVPIYIIFDPGTGLLEVRQLEGDRYQLLSPDEAGRYFIPSLNLFLGVWFGKRQEQTAHWLRWWDSDGNLLLWGSERIAREQERAEQERQRADVAEQELARLRERLRDAGLPDDE